MSNSNLFNTIAKHIELVNANPSFLNICALTNILYSTHRSYVTDSPYSHAGSWLDETLERFSKKHYLIKFALYHFYAGYENGDH